MTRDVGYDNQSLRSMERRSKCFVLPHVEAAKTGFFAPKEGTRVKRTWQRTCVK